MNFIYFIGDRMTLLEKYAKRLQELREGAEEFYEGETLNIETILKLG